MATYYRWQKSTVQYYDKVIEQFSEGEELPDYANYYCEGQKSGTQYIFESSNIRNLTTGQPISIAGGEYFQFYTQRFSGQDISTTSYTAGGNYINVERNSSGKIVVMGGSPENVKLQHMGFQAGPGTSQGYVYSTSSSAYPNGGEKDGYYYDSRTMVTSPSAPGSINYPTSITSTSIQVSWGAASSETDYPVDHYELQRQINGGGWTTVNSNISVTSFTASLTSATTTYRFRVRAVDTNGQSGDWRTGNTGTKINAPGAPSVSAPSEAVSGESITVNWGTVSGATSYTVQRNTGGNWTQVYSGNALTFSETVGVWDSLQYRVQAVNQAGGGSWGYSGAITVYTSPTLSVPSQLMQGQQATVSWTAIPGADSYTLQRKSSADADWTQVYSGANLSYTETVGTWTSVQYRVQAVFSGTPGGWAESASIPVVSSSALVISGTDGDLGTVVNDIPYSISTDTGNQITATITVNSAVIFSGNVGNSTSDTIPVLDLVNGEGTIVIEASVQASGGPVSAVRTWTYTKSLITFPNAGSVAQLTKEGENIFPKTLAGCVRLSGGRTLDEVMGFPCQIYAGSYVGTGTSGSSNPNTLTFPFEPKVVFIVSASGLPASGEASVLGPLVRGGAVADTAVLYPPANFSESFVTVTWESNQVSWYHGDDSLAQQNYSGAVYNFVVFG